MTLGAARVIWTINDLSLYVDNVALGYVTMIIKAERGPIGVPRLVTSLEEYRRIFGLKVPYTDDPLVCEMALRQRGRLNVIRTAHYTRISDPTTLTAKKSSVTLYDRGNTETSGYVEGNTGPFKITRALPGTVTNQIDGPYTIVEGTGDQFKYRVGSNGVWGNPVTVTLSSGSQTATQIANQLAASGSGILVSAIAEGSRVRIKAASAQNDVEILAVSNDAYSTLGFQPGVYYHTGGNDRLVVSIDGGVDQSFVLDDGQEEAVFMLTSAEVVAILSSLSGGVATTVEGRVAIQSNTTGSSSSVQIKSTSTAYSVLGFDTELHRGCSGPAQPTILVTAANEGDWGDDIRVFIYDSPLNSRQAFDMKVAYLRQGTMTEWFPNLSMDIGSDRYFKHWINERSRLIQVEDLGSTNVVYSSTGWVNRPATSNALPGQVLGNVSSVYNIVAGSNDKFSVRVRENGVWGSIETITLTAGGERTAAQVAGQIDSLAGISSRAVSDNLGNTYVFVSASEIGNDIEIMPVANSCYATLGIAVGEYNHVASTSELLGYALSGGDNGLDGFNDADWIGDGPSLTGMYAADGAFMSMDLMIPGTTSATVYQAMIAYCESRADMIAYGQVPPLLAPEDAVNWRLGNAPWTHPAFDSHRFCLFYGRPLVYDDQDGQRKYISCLGHLAACLCRTDNDYGPHYAPVGPRRGRVTLVEGIDFDVQTNKSTGYADLFAENGINYLMMSRYTGIEGAMFWEQRTTQRAPSALRELNVVRFITVMNRMLLPVLRTFLFEPNHPVTWREIHRTLEPAFQDWKNKYSIYDYALQTDRDAWFDGGVLKNAVLNSGLDMDRGIYHCRALIQPTRTIYYLEFELGVMRTGEPFEKFTEMTTLPGWIKH